MNDYFKQYYNEHKNDPEFMRKRRDAQRRYYMHRKENPKPKKTEHDPHAITKEEWLRQYGYPMGDTTGWENWTGWDTRIRRGEEE